MKPRFRLGVDIRGSIFVVMGATLNLWNEKSWDMRGGAGKDVLRRTIYRVEDSERQISGLHVGPNP